MNHNIGTVCKNTDLGLCTTWIIFGNPQLTAETLYFSFLMCPGWRRKDLCPHANAKVCMHSPLSSLVDQSLSNFHKIRSVCRWWLMKQTQHVHPNLSSTQSFSAYWRWFGAVIENSHHNLQIIEAVSSLSTMAQSEHEETARRKLKELAERFARTRKLKAFKKTFPNKVCTGLRKDWALSCSNQRELTTIHWLGVQKQI